MRECLRFIEFRSYIDIFTFNSEIICNKKWNTVRYGTEERYGRFVSLFMKYGVDFLPGKLNTK